MGSLVWLSLGLFWIDLPTPTGFLNDDVHPLWWAMWMWLHAFEVSPRWVSSVRVWQNLSRPMREAIAKLWGVSLLCLDSEAELPRAFSSTKISHALSASPDILASSILIGALFFLRRKIEQIYPKSFTSAGCQWPNFGVGVSRIAQSEKELLWQHIAAAKWNCHETHQFVPQPCFALLFEDWQGLCVTLLVLRYFKDLSIDFVLDFGLINFPSLLQQGSEQSAWGKTGGHLVCSDFGLVSSSTFYPLAVF